jgi:hypothetical protein
MTQAETAAPEQARDQAQETSAPSLPGDAIRDASVAYERYVFPARDGAEEAKPAQEEKPASEAPQTEQKAETEAPKGEAEPEGGEELEKLLSDPKIKRKIEDIVNGRLGTRLEQERKKIREQLESEVRQQEQKWQEATQYYQRLVEDPDFAEEQERQYGREAVETFKRNYELAASARAAQADPVIRQAVAAQVITQFHEQAVSDFKDVVQSLPIWDRLPADAKETIQGLQFEPTPGTSWFEKGMQALADGIAKMLQRIEDDHRKALEEAREAGRNEAAARREAVRPIVMGGKIETAEDAQRVIYEYGMGIGSWTREDFNRARRILRQDY